MQAAREAGAEWAEIGAALGISKQAAWESYKRKIEAQKTYVADYHDSERARAVPGVEAAGRREEWGRRFSQALALIADEHPRQRQIGRALLACPAACQRPGHRGRSGSR